jgi:hypothetical protein
VTAGGITVTAGASSFGAAVSITGTCTATTFAGSGASLTNLPAANITGTLPNAQLPTAISVTTVATSSTVTAAGGFVQSAGKSYTQRTASSGSGSVTLDLGSTNWHVWTLTGSVTALTITNMTEGQTVKLFVINQASYTVAWTSAVNLPSPGTLVPTASKTDWYELTCGAGGVINLCIQGQGYANLA